MKQRRLKVGLIGLGRMGKVYARDLARTIPNTELVAVADVDVVRARTMAEEYDVPACYANSRALLEDKNVEAAVITTPTRTHYELVLAAADYGKAVFCEKPLALALNEALEMKKAVARAAVFFQMGFMRRFDKGYAAAKHQLDADEIGQPILFRATSRDPFPPSLTYANPINSGGLILDMGIHDFDLARWFVGEITSASALGSALACPELQTVGDIDAAVISLKFVSGQIGSVDLMRNGVYGYDITTEIVGTRGTLRIGYLRETPVLVMKKNHIAHDVVPYFMERFSQAYFTQLQNFAENVLLEREAPITIEDGIAALRVALAATEALRNGGSVQILE